MYDILNYMVHTFPKKLSLHHNSCFFHCCGICVESSFFSIPVHSIGQVQYVNRRAFSILAKENSMTGFKTKPKFVPLVLCFYAFGCFDQCCVFFKTFSNERGMLQDRNNVKKIESHNI